jgi:glycosyltransferase involved in cell wall biosynthesis
MQTTKKTYVVIPVYNEGSVVLEVVNEIRKHFKNIVCINDGSTDDSSQKLRHADVMLVEHPFNLGQGAALQTGIDYALQDPRAQYFITYDADGQHSFTDALNMLKRLKKDKLDIVTGSRFIGNAENISPVKKTFLRLVAIFSRHTTGLTLTDPYNGLRVFNRNFAQNLKLTLSDFSHPTEIAQRVAEGQYKFGEEPVTIKYTDYSKSKGQPMLNSVNILVDLLFHRISKK